MSGPAGVMSVILLETAVGGAVVLWTGGVWGVVRRGFFLLTGVTLALCAVGAWAIMRGESTALSATLGTFAGLLVAWQVLLLLRQEAASRWVGLIAAAAGLATLPPVAALRSQSVALGLVELALGAVFLGSAVYGLLLGHWYLVERRLPNQHMVRGARWYTAGVVAALAAAGLSALNPIPESLSGSFSPFLATGGFTVMLAIGLVVICAMIAGFVLKLASEGGRSIQAATGYFYLAVIMAFSAELASKYRFFT